MGGTQTLTPEPASEPAAVMQGCPRCDDSRADAPTVVTSLFDERPLRRCRRCGLRFTAGEPPHRLIRTCDPCSLPFLDDETSAAGRPRCPDCCSGRTPSDLLDASVVSATEAEVRLALDEQWRFVTSDALSTYLGGMIRRLAGQLEGAASSSRIVLIDDPALRSLALPSGIVLISEGLLSSLEDEAELAFVIGHELAHATSGDASAGLVRLGLHTVSREQSSGAPAREVWARAASDLIRLGYGRRRERNADRAAIAAMVSLGYDPQSVPRCLARFDARADEGDTRFVEYAFAHPALSQRGRWIQSDVAASDRPTSGYRVNRELFRRVAGHSALADSLVPRPSMGQQADAPPGASTADRISRGFFWAGLGIMLLIAAIAILALALSD